MEKFLNLEFRGEGNCAIVFANPQTKHVYRLVKCNATRKIRKLLQNGISDIYTDDKNIQSAVKSELDNVVTYMKNIMRPLLTDRYVVLPVLTSIPEGFGENAVALAGEARPAHRKNSQKDSIDPGIRYALVLPDCCFVRHSDSNNLKKRSKALSSIANDSLGNSIDVDSEVMSKGSQKTIRSNSYCSSDSQESTSDLLDESMDINLSTCDDDVNETTSYTYHPSSYIINATENGDSHIYAPNDRICSRKVPSDSSINSFLESTPDLSSSNVEHEPHKDDVQFTLSIEIKPKKAFMTKSSSDSQENSQVCRFCMHQHLKRKSGMWPQTSSYCPLDLFSGNKQRMKHALFSLIKTPQNNLKICKNGREVYGSDIRTDLCSVLQDWFPVNQSRRPKLVSVFLDLVIEILLNTSETPSSNSDEPAVLKLQPQQAERLVQKCDCSSFVHHQEDVSQGLPQGCVLERIFSLQSLDDLDIEGVHPLYARLKERLEQEPHIGNKWCLNGPYNDLTWLFGEKGEQLDDLDPDSDDYAALKVKRFLVSKTLQDCSIIVAIKPALKSTLSRRDLLRFQGDLYEFSITVIDLDPKPFQKVKTYNQQASDIATTFAETQQGGGTSSSR